MNKYILNKNSQSNGDHEVNVTRGCSYLPAVENRLDIGNFTNCQQAIIQAKTNWPGHSINGCYYCANACHTS